MRTRTEIVVETDRWLMVSRQRKEAWCPTCLRQVETFDDLTRKTAQKSQTDLIQFLLLVLLCGYQSKPF